MDADRQEFSYTSHVGLLQQVTDWDITTSDRPDIHGEPVKNVLAAVLYEKKGWKI